MANRPFETAESFESPAVRQLSIFLEDRVGTLMRLFKVFEGSAVRVVGLTIIHEVDCAIVRLICDDADTALDLLRARGFPVSESELLVVEIPQGTGLMSICSAMLAAEVNINYAYPLMVRPTGRAALAIHTEDLETACQVLRSRQFCLMSEEDLGPGPAR
ncbi:MAG: acetolactate synthase [Planctomycetota bacterium]|nr:acetolactate synthase [Planctomycetota bacterium]